MEDLLNSLLSPKLVINSTTKINDYPSFIPNLSKLISIFNGSIGKHFDEENDMKNAMKLQPRQKMIHMHATNFYCICNMVNTRGKVWNEDEFKKWLN